MSYSKLYSYARPEPDDCTLIPPINPISMPWVNFIELRDLPANGGTFK